jgi:hypothetical protein
VHTNPPTLHTHTSSHRRHALVFVFGHGGLYGTEFYPLTRREVDQIFPRKSPAYPPPPAAPPACLLSASRVTTFTFSAGQSPPHPLSESPVIENSLFWVQDKPHEVPVIELSRCLRSLSADSVFVVLQRSACPPQPPTVENPLITAKVNHYLVIQEE